MASRRIERVNSLLREVITEVIRRDVRDPDVDRLAAVTRVDTSKDLRHAKVYVSLIGTLDEKQKTVNALQKASAFIAITASKKVVLRYFPELIFRVDDSIDKQMQIEEIIQEIEDERSHRDHES